MREATTATRYGHNLHILWPILNENAAKRKAAGETQIKMYVQYRQFMASSSAKSIEKQATRRWCRTQKQQQRRADRPFALNGNTHKQHSPGFALPELLRSPYPLATLAFPQLALYRVLKICSRWNEEELKKLICEILSESSLIIWEVVCHYGV